MKIKANELAQIALLAKFYINKVNATDFNFLLSKIDEIAKLACKADWNFQDENILIEEMP